MHSLTRFEPAQPIVKRVSSPVQISLQTPQNCELLADDEITLAISFMMGMAPPPPLRPPACLERAGGPCKCRALFIMSSTTLYFAQSLAAKQKRERNAPLALPRSSLLCRLQPRSPPPVPGRERSTCAVPAPHSQLMQLFLATVVVAAVCNARRSISPLSSSSSSSVYSVAAAEL